MLPSSHWSRARSSSIPRQYHRNRATHDDRFSVTDAVHLKLRLQSLDNAISDESRKYDIKKVEEACQLRPFYETLSPYVDGSEEFFLLVKSISRPDLIPDVYLEAYRAVLDRRPYLNLYKVSDFKKGVDPTFSEIRVLLSRIDAVCETDLGGAFSRLEKNGIYILEMTRSSTHLKQSNHSHSFNCRLSFDCRYIRIFCLAKPTSPFCTIHIATKSLGYAWTSCGPIDGCIMKSPSIYSRAALSS